MEIDTSPKYCQAAKERLRNETPSKLFLYVVMLFTLLAYFIGGAMGAINILISKVKERIKR